MVFSSVVVEVASRMDALFPEKKETISIPVYTNTKRIPAGAEILKPSAEYMSAPPKRAVSGTPEGAAKRAKGASKGGRAKPKKG